MNPVTIIDDLYRYNDWAHGRLFRLCSGLDDASLDQPREMGFGSLRATLFHILAAEQIWLERWQGIPWRPFPTDPAGASLAEIEAGLKRAAADRRELLDRERESGWRRVVTYRDSKGVAYERRLDDLLVHVANHGICHRSQALNMLKGFGRTVPAGLDYAFYRLALPSVRQTPETLAAMRGFGMEVDLAPGVGVCWDCERVQRYFGYNDWANGVLLGLAIPLEAAVIDRQFDMGLGTIRKTLAHLYDAERWWLANWTSDTTVYEHSPATIGLEDLREQSRDLARRRDAFIGALDEAAAQRIVVAAVGPMKISVPIIESLVQLCGHGTHHRTQAVNMLRQVGVKAPPLDYAVWLGLA